MLSLEWDTMTVTNERSNFLEGGLEERDSH